MNSKRRSELMAGIRSRDTVPELTVRRIAHRMGLRFRLHRSDLPGRPDLVFPKFRLAVFVHGCFWHRHERCRYASTPKSRVAFWTEKFATNVDRDIRKGAALRNLGWRVFVIWECETKDKAALECKLTALIRCDGTAPEQEIILTDAKMEHQASTQGMETPVRLRSIPSGVELGFSEQT